MTRKTTDHKPQSTVQELQFEVARLKGQIEALRTTNELLLRALKG